ncbi:MAG TPA: FAD-dependent oxidoreductase [Candidatus Acidoferrales bacterium]|nr:FAD-dependent oxidoreductase [Candidatus Acidoferrales bacterium]
METVDAIIIGSGQGGVPLATDMASQGRKVVLFERGRFGGSCINYGCTPSKALLAAAHSAGRARRMTPLGVSAQVSVDFGAVMSRVRGIRDRFEQSIERRLTDAGVRVVRKSAAFSGERTVTGGDVVVCAPIVIIDTGTSAHVPELPGLAGTPFLTNENIFDLSALPKRLLVMGAGYIGLELGQGMARLGSEVHIIDPNPRVLAREDADATDVLQHSLRRDGVTLHLGRDIKSIGYTAGFEATLDDGERLDGDALLVAVGRTPNTAQLNVGASGITLDARGYVAANERLETACAGVYALGDVAGQPQFTHVSWEDFRRIKSILAGGQRTRDDRILAYTTFTEPQVARVGLDAEQAKQKGIAARSVTLGLDRVARAIEWNEEEGFYRLLVDDDDRILGATLVGYEAGELIHIILAHMEAGATWHALDASVHVHPTYAEGLPTLARLLAPPAMSMAPGQ